MFLVFSLTFSAMPFALCYQVTSWPSRLKRVDVISLRYSALARISVIGEISSNTFLEQILINSVVTFSPINIASV